MPRSSSTTNVVGPVNPRAASKQRSYDGMRDLAQLDAIALELRQISCTMAVTVLISWLSLYRLLVCTVRSFPLYLFRPSIFDHFIHFFLSPHFPLQYQ